MSEADRLHAKLAYEAMAPLYDGFTRSYRSADWVASLLPALERHGLRKGSLLDVGCGTGKLGEPMIERGWRVSGCDLSPAMLERARAKLGADVPLTVADMRELPALGRFDLVWALGDPVGYLLSHEELVAGLEGMRRNLAPTGLVVFDLNTRLGLETLFGNDVAVEMEIGGEPFAWRGRTPAGPPPDSIYEAAAHTSGTERTHRLRHYEQEEVLAALAEAGLESLDVFGQAEDMVPRRPVDEREHVKAIYVARARSRSRRRPGPPCLSGRARRP